MPVEYSGEEQAIVAVGLARPRPGVFVEAIQHLLVLCTTTEARRAAPCCCRNCADAAGVAVVLLLLRFAAAGLGVEGG